MRRRLHGEQGVAMMTVVIVMVIAALLVVALTVASNGAISRSKQERQRSMQQNAVDQGVAVYLHALNDDVVNEATGWYLGAAQARAYGTVVPNASLPGSLGNLARVDSSTMPVSAQWTMRSAGPSESTLAYWQVYSIGRPTFAPGTAGRVIVYLRGWVTTTTNQLVGQASLARVEFRPGRFADYEVLTDGPVVVGAGATINGPVHSNGGKDMLFGFRPPAQVVFSSESPAPVCSRQARFTTTSGAVDFTNSPTCRGKSTDTGTGLAVNVLQADDAYARALRYCGGTPYVDVRCFTRPTSDNGTADTSDDFYQVNLSSFAATTRPVVLLFNANVHVSGQIGRSAAARVTIIAHSVTRGVVAGYNGASIYLDGNTGEADIAHDALGLVADGDIVLPLGPCVTSAQGAFMGAGGTMSFPVQWRTPTDPQVPRLPTCSRNFRFTGAIAGHYTPAMVIEYQTGRKLGYTNRTFDYDRYLYDDPPPFYPLAGPWQSYGFADANSDCFDAAGHLTGPSCH